MSRRLLVAVAPGYPEERDYLKRREISRRFRDDINMAYNYFEGKLDSINWNVTKVYDIGDRQEDALKGLDYSLEMGYSSVQLTKRLVDNGAKLTMLGESTDFLELIAWHQELEKGNIDNDFLFSVYEEFGMKLGHKFDKNLKEGEIGFYNNSFILTSYIEFPKSIDLEILDPMGIYKNKERWTELSTLM